MYLYLQISMPESESDYQYHYMYIVMQCKVLWIQLMSFNLMYKILIECWKTVIWRQS